jgi:hypothetical protein
MLRMAQESGTVGQTRRPALASGPGLARPGVSRVLSGHLYQLEIRNRAASHRKAPCQASPDATLPWAGRSAMHRADLLKPDLLSEIVLLGIGTLIFVSLLLIVVTALTRV